MERAEGVNFLIAAGSLIAELVAGYVDDFESLVVVLPVHFFELLILRCEAAACRGVDDDENLTREC